MMAMLAVGAGGLLACAVVYLLYRQWALDRDMSSLTHDYRVLQKELKAAHQRHVQMTEGQLHDLGTAERQTRHRLSWVESWVAHWVQLTQRQGTGR